MYIVKGNKAHEVQIKKCPTCHNIKERSRQLHYCQHLKLALYRGAGKSLARPASRCILFDGENISFDVSLVIYSNNITLIMIINRTYEHQNLLSL